MMAWWHGDWWNTHGDIGNIVFSIDDVIVYTHKTEMQSSGIFCNGDFPDLRTHRPVGP
jgi:hypothetical protein